MYNSAIQPLKSGEGGTRSRLQKWGVCTSSIKICIVYISCWSQWPRVLRRRSTAFRLLRLWVRIPPGAWMFVVSVVCCQVEVSATGWSLVQRSLTDCGASLCVWSRNLENEEAKARYRAVKIQPRWVVTPGKQHLHKLFYLVLRYTKRMTLLKTLFSSGLFYVVFYVLSFLPFYSIINAVVIGVKFPFLGFPLLCLIAVIGQVRWWWKWKLWLKMIATANELD